MLCTARRYDAALGKQEKALKAQISSLSESLEVAQEELRQATARCNELARKVWGDFETSGGKRENMEVYKERFNSSSDRGGGGSEI